MLQRVKSLWREVALVGGHGIRRTPVVVVYMLLTAGLDLLGVALIAPFIAMMMQGPSPSAVPATLLALLGARPMRMLGLLLILVFAIKMASSFVLQRAITRVTEQIRADVAVRLLAAYQRREYLFHLNSNSSDLINNVAWYSQAFAGSVIGSSLRLVADGVVFAALVMLMVLANPIAVVLMALVLTADFILIGKFIRQRGEAVARTIADSTAEVIRSTTQALGGLREVRVLGCEKFFTARLEKAVLSLVSATERSAVYGIVPRQVIELSMVVFLVLLVFVATLQGATKDALVPVLGLIGAAAVRLMPASTALISNLNQLRANRFVVRKLAEELAAARPPTVISDSAPKDDTPRPLSPFKGLSARNLTFSYSAQVPPVFSGLDFEIQAGDAVGIIGPSGTGKSTLADLLLGFLQPTTGTILVDGADIHDGLQRWQSRVAFIPQQPYLIDDTIARNVALGLPDDEIDEEHVNAVLGKVQLAQVIAALPEGIHTNLGERGVKFSGGQRQRIALARALYRKREILILDEATSALDKKTETEIVELIQALHGKQTIIIISHSETSISVCNKFINLQSPTPFADVNYPA